MAVDKEGRHTARGFEPAGMIMDYITEERERCAELVELIRDNPEQLLKCIRSGVWPDEFVTPQSETSEPDDFEDLM